MFKINNNIVSKLCPSPTLPLSLRLFFVLDFIFMLMSIIMIAVVFIFHRNMSGLMSLYSYLYTVLYFRKDEFNFRVLFATTSIRFIFFYSVSVLVEKNLIAILDGEEIVIHI